MYDWPWPDEVLNAPAFVSPDGIYNFDVQPPHDAGAYVLIAICLILTTIGALSRGYARFRVIRKVHLEDCKCWPTLYVLHRGTDQTTSSLDLAFFALVRFMAQFRLRS